MSEWCRMQAVNAASRSRWKIGLSTHTSFRCPASAQGSLVMYTSPGRNEPRGRPCTSFLMPSAIAPDWQGRVANYRAFMSEELRDYVRNSGVQVIGYRAVRELMR